MAFEQGHLVLPLTHRELKQQQLPNVPDLVQGFQVGDELSGAFHGCGGHIEPFICYLHISTANSYRSQGELMDGRKKRPDSPLMEFGVVQIQSRGYFSASRMRLYTSSMLPTPSTGRTCPRAE